MARKALSKKTRFEVFKRDAFTCQYCGSHPPSVILHVDHIHPVAEGGTNDQDNLITACQSCNLGKGARLLSDVPNAIRDMAKDLADREEQLRGYNKLLKDRAIRIENESWEIAEALEGVIWIDDYITENLESIKIFLARLPFEEVLSAAKFAESKFPFDRPRGFKYFCGTCWTKIREAGGGTR